MADVIVVGEMRDPETMQIALAAGETGHLVLSTLHTTDVASTIARMTDSFPAERQPTIRQEIAAALSAVFVQTLLPRVTGGRVPAAELLVVQYGARQLPEHDPRDAGVERREERRDVAELSAQGFLAAHVAFRDVLFGQAQQHAGQGRGVLREEREVDERHLLEVRGRIDADPAIVL